eukprot:EG_transcript_6905
MWEDAALRDLPMDRVQVIEGDLRDPEFFETPTLQLLQKRITRIVHVAASVNMDESLETALSNNLLPGIRLYQWARKCPLCTHLVITSTAFVNAPSEQPIYEGPCPPLPGVEVSQLTNFESFPPWPEIQSYHFTTYTWSKAALEHYLAYLHWQDPGRFRLSFVRPSIVSVALSDPFPGWNTSLDALNGVIALHATGLLSGNLHMKRPTRLNVVPVDYVAECIVNAAFHRNDDTIAYVHAAAAEHQHIFTDPLGVIVVDHGQEFYRGRWRAPKMRYQIDESRWTYAKFQLIDVLPFAVASLFGSRRQRKTAKKTLYILRSVYATLIQFYASNVFNFHSATPPAFDVEEYMLIVTRGTYETLASRGLLKPRPRAEAAVPSRGPFRSCLDLLPLCGRG